MIWIGFNTGNHFTEYDAVAEDVAAVVVIETLETFGGHPVGGAGGVEFYFAFGVGNLGGKTEITDDGLQVAILVTFYKDILDWKNKNYAKA